MKKFIYKAIAFALFGMISYVCFLVLYGEFSPKVFATNLVYPLGGNGHLYTRVREIPEYKDVDILFLGSSHVYRGFDVRICSKRGYTNFNLGSSSQTPMQSYTLLKRYFDQLNPKVIVYEVSPMGFLNNGAESALDLIANDRLDMTDVKGALLINDIKVYNTLLYGAYRRVFNRDRGFREPWNKGVDQYFSGGFVERVSGFFDGKLGDETIQWQPYDYQVKAFDQLMEYAHKKGVKVVLVQIPISKAKYKQFDDSEEIDDFFLRRGIYYNFNQMDCGLVDNQHFFDDHHLNQAGVIVFDDLFFDLLPSLLDR